MASSATRSLLALTAATALAAACSTGAPGPRIDSVSPAAARNTSSVRVTVAGRNFYRKIVPDAGNPSSSATADVRVIFSNATTSFALVLSSSMSVTELSGTVEPGHAMGSYDVTVFADGGSVTAHDGFAVSGSPVALAFSSATEAVPGTADVVTLTATLKDALGNATSPDSTVHCTLAAPSARGATLPSSFSVGTSQTGATVTIADRVAEQFGVGCANSLAPLTVTTGSATFLAGPPHAVKVLDASGALFSTIPSSVLLEDLDGNPIASHVAAYHVTISSVLHSGGPCSSPTISPLTVVLVSGSSLAPFTAADPSCGITTTFELIPTVQEGLVGSSGLLTW